MTQQSSAPRRGLDGVFIVPGDNLGWSQQRWNEAIRDIAAAGMGTVIVQWCAASGRALYPSPTREPLPGMALEDVVAAILAAAAAAGLEVILGVDGTRALSDIHYDPVEGPTQRLAQTLQELLARYGAASALRGFYLPQEWSILSDVEDAQTIIECAKFCHHMRRDLMVCTTAPPPKLAVTGRGWELFERDAEAVNCLGELISTWAYVWSEVAQRAGLDAVLVRDDLGSRRCATDAARAAYEALSRRLLWNDCEVWAQVGLYEVAHRREDRDPADLHPADIKRLRQQLRIARDCCRRSIGFSYDDIDPAAGGEPAALYEAYVSGARTSRAAVESPPVVERRPARPSIASPLLDKAMALERRIEERHLLEGQIMTVVDYRYDLDHPQNYWQEDADWLTGLYTGAQSLRFAATGDADARARARRSFEALCMLSTVSGVPGVVARSFRRSFAAGSLGTGRKRWRKVEGHDLWWGTDISRDQLSGHLFGLAAYHDLVADESERKTIRRLVSDIVGSLLDHRMQAVDWDGEYTTHGNFWVAPFQALAVLKMAYHITRERRFDRAYWDYVNPHFFHGHALLQARRILDPFYQHYQWDSPAYHLLQYETDSDFLYLLLRSLDLVYADVKDLGNVYFLFVYQTYRPESDAARRGELELLEFNPEHQYRANYTQFIQRVLAEREEALPDNLVDTLRYYLEPDQAPANHVASFIPMGLRPPMEFNWQYYAAIQTRWRSGGWSPGGEFAGYAGVDYLLAYWMGRYHGFVR
jgi:hypothetical protein